MGRSVRFAGSAGRTKERRIERLTINIAPPAAKAKEKPAGLSRRVVCLCDMKANPPA